MPRSTGGWVTPRRGKAVEINALYYNALRILEQLLVIQGDVENARRMDDYANRARTSFNERFWYDQGQYLYDVVDPDDPALRPNQIFSISLDFPVLDESRWKRVVDVVHEKLLTPSGLRSLSRDHPDYKATYDGDLRSTRCAYPGDGVVVADSGRSSMRWVKVHPSTYRAARVRLVEGFKPHLATLHRHDQRDLRPDRPPTARAAPARLERRSPSYVAL